jgi:hypothetical protein
MNSNTIHSFHLLTAADWILNLVNSSTDLLGELIDHET